tara:strand:- start:394 stop:654 length:261 start_codon:yes stop_codon:yes gene_type:complete
MPKYCYQCEKCDISFEIIHSIKEKRYDCETCETSGSLNRIPFIATTVSKKPPGSTKPGELVNRFIKEASEEIKIEKEKYKKEEYKK